MSNPNAQGRGVSEFFGLTYSAYLVIPRLALESMPADWQRRFVALLDEAAEAGLSTPSDYEVRRRAKGQFTADPWANYRRGDLREIAPEVAAALAEEPARG